MADISAFSNASFDSAAWVNSALANLPEGESPEAFLAALAMKVHVVAQDYADQLENGMLDAMASMPRALSEINRMEEVLKNLDDELFKLSEQISTFDSKNAAGVEELSRLDTLKSNIETCKGTLEEHARWNQVVRESWALLESGGHLSETADRIEIMLKSLSVLKNVPGHEDREETCNSIIAALFSALRPRIHTDVMSHNLTAIADYIYVYNKLERSDELEKEYTRLRPEPLAALWASSYSSASDDLSEWLRSYYAALREFLDQEYKALVQLFGVGKASNMLTTMLLSISKPVIDDFTSRLNQSSRKLSQNSQALLSSYLQSEEFAASAFSVLGTQHVDKSLLLEALVSIISAFVQFAAKFVELEDSFTRTELTQLMESTMVFDSLKSDSLFDDSFVDELETSSKQQVSGADGRKILQELDSENFDDLQRVLENFSEKFVAVADASFVSLSNSMMRSCEYCRGCRIKSSVKLMTSTLKNHISGISNKLTDLRSASGLNALEDMASGKLNTSDDKGSDSFRVGAGGSGNDTSDIATALAKMYGLAGQQHVSSAKLLIPCALKCMQAVGRLFVRLLDFEEMVANQLNVVLSSIFQAIDFADFIRRQANGQKKPSAKEIGGAVINSVLEADMQALSELRGFLMLSTQIITNRSRVSSTSRGSRAMSMSDYFELASSSQILFSALSSTLQQLRFAAGSYLFDLCALMPETLLRDFGGWVSFSDVQEDEFADSSVTEDSLLPQTTITQIGEHLLSLVNEIETFAMSEAISDLQPLIGCAADLRLSQKGWNQLDAMLGVKEGEKSVAELLSGRNSCRDQISAWRATLGLPYVSSSAEGAEEDKSMRFVNEWLTEVADHVVGLLTVQLLKCQALSQRACSQLKADLAYLINVVNALGIHPHPFLAHLSYLFSEGSAAAIARVLDSSVSDSATVRLTQMASLITVHQKLRKLIINKD